MMIPELSGFKVKKKKKKNRYSKHQEEVLKKYEDEGADRKGEGDSEPERG